MTSQSTLIRRTDGKKFKVVDLAHWSTIAAEDGEQDSVKWYGGDGYVSASEGHSYFLMKCAHVVDNYTNETCGAVFPCREHK
jgi:hypothetical protein